MKLNRKVLFLTGGLLLALLSCTKMRLNRQTTSFEGVVVAQNSFHDVFKLLQVAKSEIDDSPQIGNKSMLFSANDSTNDCLGIKLTSSDSDHFDYELTVDFGEEHCLMDDNKIRKGKIIIQYSGKYKDKGFKASVETKAYHIQNNKVNVSFDIINQGENEKGDTEFRVNGVSEVTTVTDEEVYWEFERTYTWSSGMETTFWTKAADNSYLRYDAILDDLYLVSGKSNGVNRRGRAFDFEITSDLYLEYCNNNSQVTKGEARISPEDLKERSVDFGMRTCDQKAEVQVGKKTYEVDL